MMSAFKKLANMVYPLVGNVPASYNKKKYHNKKYNKYASDSFSNNNMNSTLDKMKRNY